MKKHLQRVGKVFSKQPSQYAALFFAIFFGLMMLVIGLSQLFAQSTVAFLLQPYSQSANANENKSLTINLNTGGQQVDGGNIRVTYDPAQLSYVSFNDLGGPSVSISNKVSTAGSYSFDFQIYSGSQNSPNLGTLTLKTNTVSASQAAYIKFDAANTYAYQGFNTTSRTFYPAAYGQAAIVVSAASQPQPTTSTPTTSTPTPATSSPIKPSPNATNPTPTPTTQVGPRPTTQQPTTFNGEPVILSSEAGKPVIASSKSKKIAPIAFISVGLGLVLAGVGLLVYKRYMRDLPLGLSLGNLHTGLFDETPKSSEGEIVVAPAVAARAITSSDKPQTEQHLKIHPQIITKSKDGGLPHTLLSADPKKIAPDHSPAKPPAPKTAATPSDIPKQAAKPKIPPADHKLDTKAETTTKNSHPPTHAHPMKTIMPLRPPQAPPPLVPVLPQAPEMPAQVAKNIAPVPLVQHQPDWQSQLKVSHNAPKDNPPDMFELAKEHPESFGSSQLYEVETKEKGNDNSDKK